MKHVGIKLIFIAVLIGLLLSCSKEKELILPRVVKSTVVNISYYSVDINIEVDYGNVDCSEIGIEYYSENKEDSKKNIVNHSNIEQKVELKGLAPNQIYKYRVYVKCEKQVIWSNEYSFKTMAIPQGIINRLSYSELSETGFTVKVSCTMPDGFPKQDLEFVIRELNAKDKVMKLRADGDSVKLEGLKPNTYYGVKALLTNEGGAVESSELLVQTLTGAGKWNYLFGDVAGRFFPVFISDEENNIYFGLGADGRKPGKLNDWNKFNGKKTVSLSPFPGYVDTSRDNAGFCIGDNIYIVSSNGEVWCYDIKNNSWGRKNDFTSATVTQCCFSYNGKGYYGFGLWSRDTLFEYDPKTDTWKKLKNCPIRIDRGIFFLFNGFLYVGLGETKEVYKYSIQENSWARVADFPGSAVMDVLCFSIGNKGYVVGGLANGSYEGLTEVWEYNSFNNKWTRKADLPERKVWGACCNYGQYGIVADGGQNINFWTSSVYFFDPNGD